MDELEREAREALEAEGTPPERVEVTRRIDARYLGQSFELEVSADRWTEHFHAAHEERYGYRRDDTPVEAVTVRVVAAGPPPVLPAPRLAAADGPPTASGIEVFTGGARRTTLRVRRSRLLAGHRLSGPAVIEEYSGTTWLPPGWRLEVDPWGSLHLSPEVEATA